ncbi:Cap-gly domain linker [Thalictrum thalictroides]|uniref:Cap-gly domain linker n=1 Tax=Thalictrum thalictroides TaxID=46969 RepID=A0A7J6W0A4_THATH|nr:Cap-gly domain linker [Thalictrum thalictroides]
MRKLFFFKSSSNNGNTKTCSSPPTDDKPRGEESQNPGLRRSRSLSSAASFRSGGLDESKFFSSDAIAFPSSSSSMPHHSSDYPVCNRSLNPERQQFNDAISQREYTIQNFNSPGSSRLDYDSSESSSCSSRFPLKCKSARFDHASNKVLDLYIDGEQKKSRSSRTKLSSSPRKHFVNGNRNGWRPPRTQSTAPGTPTGSFTDIPGSHSIKEMRNSHLHLITGDPTINEFGLESPQKLAKNVVKRLSQVSPYKTKAVPRGFDHDTPTTVEDIFEDYMEPHRRSCSDVPEDVYPVDTHDDLDLELHRKAKDAVDRVVHLSEELHSENLVRDNAYNVSSLLQVIRNLAEERRDLALEVSAQLQCRITDRASSKEALRVAKVEMDSQTLRLEKEKNELQSGLEKELDRRSNDWSFKFQKFQLEEQRLRERVRELAEQNVSLQREVSFLRGREGENMNRATHSEEQLKDLKTSLDEVRKENLDLQQTLLDTQEHLRSAESDRGSIQRSFKEKDKENKELHKAITRLQRTCSEQEKTISGLRQGLSDEVEKKQFSGNVDSLALQREQVRLTGVEQNLRREVESFRLEVDSLRHENIILLDRLRCSGESSASLCFKLDQELLSRVDCLQNQGLLFLAQSNQLCEKLLELIKVKAGECVEKELENGQDCKKNGLDGYLLLESDMKLQSLKAGFENLNRSLRAVSSVLHQKSDAIDSHSKSQNLEVNSGKRRGQDMENNMRFELKAEVLMTTALRDKLVAKQLEIDQLQSELATAIRGHDILRSEVQASLDAISSMSHKMKDLELQMMRKDESIHRLENELQGCSKDLNIVKGILPKVSQERDLLWEEVKQYSEKNMLLNSEVKTLKKKIDYLDEDILTKEGQISILKDSIENKTYDILSSPKSFQEFRLE